MWNRNAAVPGLLAVAVAALGACSDVPPTEPTGAGDETPKLFVGDVQLPVGEPFGLDARFVQIAQEVPGFGGLFFDESGTLNVYMTSGAQPQATRALSEHLTALQIDAAAQPVRVLEARYDFAELHTMRKRANAVLSFSKVVFTDADEARNRVVIGVEDAQTRADVENALEILGVPTDAVIIELAEPFELDQSLQNRIRPIPGGVQIAFDRSGSTFLCTLGFNVRAPSRPDVHGFVTNSHCSRQRSTMLSTPYWQPSRTPENFVGEEVHDLPFQTGGDCPAGRVCRYSDALGVQYDTGEGGQVAPADIDFGRIARTLFPGTTNPGSLQIDPDNPAWEIVEENVTLVGQTLHKTGRTSGWTMGPVTATCVDTGLSPNITLFCQHRITNLRQGGDSGSPYFRRLSEEGNEVALAGVHWGGSGFDAVMSPIENIRLENPGPVPWITFPGQTPPQ